MKEEEIKYKRIILKYDFCFKSDLNKNDFLDN